MPGEALRFKAVTLGEAKTALHQQEMRVEEVKRVIAG
jgi:allophanate hydrolase subunit 2